MKTIVEKHLTPEFVKVLDESENEPLLIEVHGKKFIVLREDIYSEQLEVFSKSGSRTRLSEFFKNSPLHGVELDLERDKTPSREVEF